MGRDREYPGRSRQNVEEKDRRDDEKSGRARRGKSTSFIMAAAGWGV